MTIVNFDLSDEIAAAGFDTSDGQLVLRYANEFTVGDTVVTTKPFTVDIVDGVGTADIYPTPVGNGLIVRVPLGSGPHGVRRRIVEVPDSATPVNFADLQEIAESSMAPPEVADAIAEGFANLAGGLAAEVDRATGVDDDHAGRLDVVETALPAKADLVGGVIPDGQLPANLARDVEVTQAVADAVALVVGAAPELLNQAAEIAAAINNDPDFANTVAAQLAAKATTAALTAEADARTLADTQLQTDVNSRVKKPDAASWPIYVYGNSYAILAAAYFTAGNHYTQQVAAALGAGAVTSYAIGGKRILDVVSSLENQSVYPGLVTAPVANSKWPGVSARNGLVVLDSIINDIGHYPTMVGTATPAALPSGNTRYLDSMALFYRHALALMTSESRIEQTARTASSGTWTQDQASAYPSGSSLSYTSAAGAYHEFSVTPPQSGPMRGIIFVHGFTLEASVGTMAQQTISVDGVVQLTRTPTAWEQYLGPGGAAVNIGPDCYAVTLPVDGNPHTVRIAHSGSAGQWMYSNFISIPSTDPNPIAVMGGEHTIAYTGWTAAQRSVFHANAKAIIPVIKALVAEFPHAFYVPSTMTPNGLWSSDALHPNDRGMAQRANDLQSAITTAARARLESRRLSNLADGNFAIV